MESYIPVNRCINFNGNVKQLSAENFDNAQENIEPEFAAKEAAQPLVRKYRKPQNLHLKVLGKKHSHHPCFIAILKKFSHLSNDDANNCRSVDAARQVYIDEKQYAVYEWKGSNYLYETRSESENNDQNKKIRFDRNNSNRANLSKMMNLNNYHQFDDANQSIPDESISTNRSKADDQITNRSITESSITIGQTPNKKNWDAKLNEDDFKELIKQKCQRRRKILSDNLSSNQLSTSENISRSAGKQEEVTATNEKLETENENMFNCHTCHRDVEISRCHFQTTPKVKPPPGDSHKKEEIFNRLGLELNLKTLKYSDLGENCEKLNPYHETHLGSANKTNDISAFESHLTNANHRSENFAEDSTNHHQTRNISKSKKCFTENILCDSCNQIIRDSVRDMLDKKLSEVLNNTILEDFSKRSDSDNNDQMMTISTEPINQMLFMTNFSSETLSKQNCPKIKEDSAIRKPPLNYRGDSRNTSIQSVLPENLNDVQYNRQNSSINGPTISQLGERDLFQKISKSIQLYVHKAALHSVTNEILLHNLLSSCERVFIDIITKRVLDSTVDQYIQTSRIVCARQSCSSNSSSTDNKDGTINKSVSAYGEKLNHLILKKFTLKSLSETCQRFIQNSVRNDLTNDCVKTWSLVSNVNSFKKKPSDDERQDVICYRSNGTQIAPTTSTQNKTVQVWGDQTNMLQNLRISQINEKLFDSQISEMILRIVKSKVHSLSPHKENGNKQIQTTISNLSDSIHKLVDNLLKNKFHNQNVRDHVPQYKNQELHQSHSDLPSYSCSPTSECKQGDIIYQTQNYRLYSPTSNLRLTRNGSKFGNPEKSNNSNNITPIICTSRDQQIYSPMVTTATPSFDEMDRITTDKLFDAPANYLKPYTSRLVRAYSPLPLLKKNKRISFSETNIKKEKRKVAPKGLLEYTQNLLHGLLRFHTTVTNYLSGRTQSRGLLTPLAECVGKYFCRTYDKYITELNQSSDFDSFKHLFRWRVNEINKTILFYETSTHKCYCHTAIPQKVKKQLFINEKVSEILEICFETIMDKRDYSEIIRLIYDLKEKFTS